MFQLNSFELLLLVFRFFIRCVCIGSFYSYLLVNATTLMYDLYIKQKEEVRTFGHFYQRTANIENLSFDSNAIFIYSVQRILKAKVDSIRWMRGGNAIEKERWKKRAICCIVENQFQLRNTKPNMYLHVYFNAININSFVLSLSLFFYLCY